MPSQNDGVFNVAKHFPDPTRRFCVHASADVDYGPAGILKKDECRFVN